MLIDSPLDPYKHIQVKCLSENVFQNVICILFNPRYVKDFVRVGLRIAHYFDSS